MSDTNDTSNGFVNPDNTKTRPDSVYGNVINQIKEHGVCPFCPDQLKNYHKKPILKETAQWILTENMYPYEGTKVHLLLIHKTHITSIEEMTKEAWIELQQLIGNAREMFKIPGATFMCRFGDSHFTGASVNHLHAQLISSDPHTEGYKPVIARVG